MRALYFDVVDVLIAGVFDGDYAVPEDVGLLDSLAVLARSKNIVRADIVSLTCRQSRELWNQRSIRVGLA